MINPRHSKIGKKKRGEKERPKGETMYEMV
jgi:hypothetical protein